MSKETLIDALAGIDDDMIQSVEALRGKKRRMAWPKWAALAACLCLIAAVVIPVTLRHAPQSPNEMMAPEAGPPSLVVDGIPYYISSHLAVMPELPEGYVQAGQASVGGFEDCPYYTNPDIPEWVYVYQQVRTDGTVDASGTLNTTPPHNAYVRYVDVRLRGKDLVCYDGVYYISMWSAQTYGDYPDVSDEYYDTMERTYGIRLEGDAPAGFACVGITEFSGKDTIPCGALSSNEGECEVYADPGDPDVLLVATHWYTAPVGENGETYHTGFNVYIRYDCPLVG